MKSRKGILLILDGYGEGKSYAYNAVENAVTPYLDYLKSEMPSCLLKTDSLAVGLPNGTMGGSEVGHMTIGGGKIKRSMQVKVDDKISSDEFFSEKVLVEAFSALEARGGALHIAGLWSDKRIHANIEHCFALMKMAKMLNIKKVFVHAITDGRDTEPRCCLRYFQKFQEVSKTLGLGEIASLGGRFYMMDRENNLDRTEMAINKLMQISYDVDNIEKAVEKSYEENLGDEFIRPVRVKTKAQYALTDKDLFIFYNTRGDRMKQPVKMASEKFNCPIITFCNFIESDNVKYVFDEDFLTNGLSEYLSTINKKQLKISESTKYAHVTYFFNGGREEPFEGEDRIHIITQKTNDYALTPFMRAKEITESVVKAIKDKKHDAIIVNYSNPDMLGHTGNYEAVVKSLEFLDKCVEEVVETAKANNMFVLLCADHGNAEEMRDEAGNPQTAHSLNPVRCLIVDKNSEIHDMRDGGLVDVAPTFLKLMGVKENPSFEGKALF